MKKILLVSLVMFLAVSVAFSQFGIKGGINLATFGGDDKSLDIGNNNKIDPSNRLCFVGGISYRIGLIAGLAIQPEVMYVQRGAIYEISGLESGYSYTSKTTVKGDYIDIPVLVKFNLPIPVLSPYIEGGVSYDILLKKTAKATTEITTNYPGGYPAPPDENMEDEVTTNDISWIVGVGFDIFILDINARYVVGTKRLRKDNSATTTIDENATKIYNRGIILTAGFRF
jgi:hypothetical protein